MASNEDPNMKAKRARTFLYFTFLILCLRYILVLYYSSRSLEKAKQAFKGCFICIKNDLIEIAPFPRGLFRSFFISLCSKTISMQGLHFSCITVNAHVGLSSEQEAASGKYVQVNKLIREILIKIAPFHSGMLLVYKFFNQVSYPF